MRAPKGSGEVVCASRTPRMVQTSAIRWVLTTDAILQQPLRKRMCAARWCIVAGGRAGRCCIAATWHPLFPRLPVRCRPPVPPPTASALSLTGTAALFGGSSSSAAVRPRRQQRQQPWQQRRAVGRGSALVCRAERDFYQILGVGRDADKKAIKSAYRQLARK